MTNETMNTLINEFKAGMKISAERQTTVLGSAADGYQPANVTTVKTIAEIKTTERGGVAVRLKGSKRVFRMYRREEAAGVKITTLRSMFPTPLAYEVF